MSQKNEGFSSILGFILVAIGFAVGVGSLWRFPYVVGSNGGALFILLYVAIILIIGIPLLTAEITMGFKSQKTAIQTYKTLAPNRPWYLGSYLHIAAAIIILGYTIPIYAWILKYIPATLMGDFKDLSPTEIGDYFTKFSSNKTEIFLFGALNYGLTMLVIYRGLQRGIERLSKILLPLLAVIMVVIIGFGLTLPGAMEGISFLFKPNFEQFTFDSLLICLGQAFFAVGIAMLASMVFGGYIRNSKENIFKSASIICAALVFAGIAAGLMIFPMVFASGLEPDAGVGLTFITLPNVFNDIPMGTLIGTLFYVGFYIAAFTSTLGVAEALVAVVMEEFKVLRGRAIIYTFMAISTIAIPTILSDTFFGWMDHIENNYLLILGALIIAIFCGWVWKIDNLLEAANIKHPFIRFWMKVSILYLSPIVILILFTTQFFN